jgi:predicted PurR-regulated permease PerM
MSELTTWSRPAKMLILFAAFVVSIAGIRAVAPILVPLLLAVFVSIVCAPLYFGLQRLRLPSFLALMVLLALLLAITFVGVALLEGSAITLRDKLPIYQDILQQRSGAFIAWLAAHGVETETFELKRILDWKQGFQLAGTSLATLTGLLGSAFIVLLLTAFILVEASILPTKLRGFSEFTASFWSNLQQTFNEIRRYMALKTVMSLLTGALVGVWLAVMGVDFVVLLAFSAFALNYIPTIGSILAAIPGVVLSLIQHGPGAALVVAIGYVVINVSVSNVVEPRVMGRGLGLSPLVVIISMFFWGWVLGPVGMLLSVPLTMTAKIAMDDFEETRWLAVLLSGGDGEQQEAEREESRDDAQQTSLGKSDSSTS